MYRISRITCVKFQIKFEPRLDRLIKFQLWCLFLNIFYNWFLWSLLDIKYLWKSRCYLWIINQLYLAYKSFSKESLYKRWYKSFFFFFFGGEDAASPRQIDKSIMNMIKFIWNKIIHNMQCYRIWSNYTWM